MRGAFVRPLALICGAIAALTAAPGALARQPAPPPLLAAPFTDHAVLQRDKPLRIWGSAEPGARLQVRLGGRSASATAGADGRWQAVFPPAPAGGPYELTVTSSSGRSETLRDVVMGDVWLCSGQSNMEMPIRLVANGEAEAAASANPNIRLLQAPRASRARAQSSFGAAAAWRLAEPQSVAHFSAACYFMGRQLQPVAGAPIGLINASWGGSIVQDWISPGALRTLGDFGEPLDILAEYDVSPAKAEARWRTFTDAWWAQRDRGAGWKAPETSDAAWPEIRVGMRWEDAGIAELAGFDGIVWYRTTFDLTPAQAAEGAILSLGPIDDSDSTWVNGQAVGATESWNTPRNYRLAPGVLKAGRNVLAVRVLDTGGGGGLWGSETPRLQLAGGGVVPLSGPWKYAVSAPLAGLGSTPHAPWVGGRGLTTLYNGMIAPVSGYGLKGVAWYQGESNVEDPAGYARLLSGLMKDWRGVFGDDLPFLVVQLAGFGPASSKPQDSPWAATREVQRLAVQADPRAGLAVAIDIGDRYDIHPANKQEVGRRLAVAARRLAYGDAASTSGPRPLAARRAGDWIEVSFGDVGPGLVLYGSDRPIGFELCTGPKSCHFAHGRAEGNKVLLEAGAGPPPKLVRFCWADSPVCNVYDAQNLPAVPFELTIDG